MDGNRNGRVALCPALDAGFVYPARRSATADSPVARTPLDS